MLRPILIGGLALGYTYCWKEAIELAGYNPTEGSIYLLGGAGMLLGIYTILSTYVFEYFSKYESRHIKDMERSIDNIK